MKERINYYLDFAKTRPEEFRKLNKFNIVTDQSILEQYNQENQPIGLIYQNKWITFLADLIDDGGKQYVYTRVIPTSSSGGGVVIIPLYHNKIVLVKHIRHAVRNHEYLLELPRGFLDADADEFEQVRREIHEEIGGCVDRVEKIGTTIANSGENGSEVAIFCTYLNDLGTVNSNEGITDTQLFSIKEAKQAIVNGDIIDGFTQSALFLYVLKNKDLEDIS